MTLESIEWHGTWKPLQMFIYDEMSDMLGPDCVLVGFEQRCGAVFGASNSGMQAAQRHEKKCITCHSYLKSHDSENCEGCSMVVSK